jgi:hypothetical protein
LKTHYTFKVNVMVSLYWEQELHRPKALSDAIFIIKMQSFQSKLTLS